MKIYYHFNKLKNIIVPQSDHMSKVFSKVIFYYKFKIYKLEMHIQNIQSVRGGKN